MLVQMCMHVRDCVCGPFTPTGVHRAGVYLLPPLLTEGLELDQTENKEVIPRG